MNSNKMIRVFIILLALALVFIPVIFYFEIEKLHTNAANAGMLIDPWEFRTFVYIELTSVVCALAVMFRSRKAYWVASGILLCQIWILISWYAELSSRMWDLRLTPGSPWLVILKENPENVAQLGIALLLLLLIGWQLITMSKERQIPPDVPLANHSANTPA
jgi:hypothetical protein